MKDKIVKTNFLEPKLKELVFEAKGSNLINIPQKVIITNARGVFERDLYDKPTTDLTKIVLNVLDKGLYEELTSKNYPISSIVPVTVEFIGKEILKVTDLNALHGRELNLSEGLVALKWHQNKGYSDYKIIITTLDNEPRPLKLTKEQLIKENNNE